MQILRTSSDESTMSADSMVPASITTNTSETSVSGEDIKERNDSESSYSNALLNSLVEAMDAKYVRIAPEAPPSTPIIPPTKQSTLNPAVEEFSPKNLNAATVSPSKSALKMDSENSAAEGSSARVKTQDVDNAEEETGSSTSSNSQSSTPSTTQSRIAPLGGWAFNPQVNMQPQLAADMPTDPKQPYTLPQYPSHCNWLRGPLGTDFAPLDVPQQYDQLRPPMMIPMDPEIVAQHPDIKPDYHNHLLLEKMWSRDAEYNNLKTRYQAQVATSEAQARRIRELEMRLQQFNGTIRLQESVLTDLEARKDAHDKLITDQDKKITQLEAGRAHDHTTIQQLHKRIEKLQARDVNKTDLIKNQENALAKKDMSSKKAVQQNQDLSTRLEMLEKNPLMHEKVIAALAEKEVQLQDKNSEMSALQAVVTQYENMLGQVNSKIYEMDKTIQANKDSAVISASESAHREAALRKLEKETAALKQEKRGLATQCDTLRVENDRLKKHKCPQLPKKEVRAETNRQLVVDKVVGDVVLIAGGDIYYKAVILGGKVIKGAASLVGGLVRGLCRFGAYGVLFGMFFLLWYFDLLKHY